MVVAVYSYSMAIIIITSYSVKSRKAIHRSPNLTESLGSQVTLRPFVDMLLSFTFIGFFDVSSHRKAQFSCMC